MDPMDRSYIEIIQQPKPKYDFKTEKPVNLLRSKEKGTSVKIKLHNYEVRIIFHIVLLTQ